MCNADMFLGIILIAYLFETNFLKTWTQNFEFHPKQAKNCNKHKKIKDEKKIKFNTYIKFISVHRKCKFTF